MSEEMNKEAEVQEEAVDIPVTDGSEEEAADTAQTAEEETSEEPAQTEETEQSDQEAESQKEPETKTKTSFFGKKKKEKDKFEQQVEELTDRLKRSMAEFDNYRKRTLREKSELIKNGGESALTHLLPVVDDFERALQNIRSAEDIKAVTEGVELIYSKFMSYLSHQNVKPIETVGEPFDAETSEAVAMIPAPEPDMKGKVLDCVQTGYTLNDKVIRHAKVVVGE